MTGEPNTPIPFHGGAGASLVSLHGGNPIATTLAIAAGTDNQHKNVMDLVRSYVNDFKEFGPLAFETRMGQALPQGGFAKATEIALLNEDQAALLITYMRNSDIVRVFKIRLIKAFREATNYLQNPANRLKTMPRSEMLLVLAGEVKEKEELRALATEQQATIVEMKPKAAFHDAVAEASGMHSFAEAAKILGTGQRKLMALLRDAKVINKHNVAYQCYQDAGYFKLKEKPIHMGHLGDVLNSQTFVLGKGLAWIQKRFFATQAGGAA